MSDNSIRLLLIEDNPGDARLIREFLSEIRNNPYLLKCADRLSKGLELLAGQDVDLVLLDLSLPDSEGFETFARVYAQVPDLPIVVVTSFNDEMLAVQAVQAGTQDYLVKGEIDSSMLSRAMRYAIERKKTEIALRKVREELEVRVEQRTEDLAKANGELRSEIAERRRVEEALRKAHDELERRVEERTAELVKVNTELRKEVEERRQAEEALKESEQKFRAIFDQTFQLIALLSTDGRLIEANTKALQFAGVQESDVIGELLWETPWWTHSTELQDKLRAAVKKAATGEFVRFETTHFSADGSLHCIDFSLKPIMDETGGVAFLIAEARDINERKRAEEALQQSEREKTILNEIANVFLTSPDEKIYEEVLAVILKALKCRYGIFGYIGDSGELIIPSMTSEIWSECQVAGKSIVFPRHLWGDSIWGKAIKEKGSLSSEGPFQTPEGHLPVCNFLTVPVVFMDRTIGLTSVANKDGGFTKEDKAILERIAGTISPILNTRLQRDKQELQRKRAEEAVMESHQRLADIIDFLPDGTFVIDREGKVIAWNRAMEEMTGIPAAEMLGKENFEYTLPFYGKRKPMLIDLVLRPREEVEAGYNYVERKETVIVGEAYTPALRGSETYLVGTAGALFDSKGNIVGAIESIRDISERRRVEEALLLAEEKYRDIVDNSVTGIYQVRLNGDFVKVNAALARIHGYDSPEEMLNEVKNSLQIHVRPARRAEMLRLIEEHGSLREFEVEFFKKDKSVVWVSLNVRTVRNPDGEIAYLEGTANDITDRKLFGARIEQMQKLEAIGTLAGGIAHDFNNILAPIIGYSELALQEIPTDTPLYRKIDQVLQSGCRAKDLVKQILTFGRKTEQERRPVQVSLIVKEALKMLRSTLPSTIDIRRDIDRDASNGTIMADPTQIHQVLMNLCTNAAHAMRSKGGTLSIALTVEDIDSISGSEIRDLEDGPYLRLSVSDTGHGMDEGVRRRIFDPYFTTKGPDEGTGLGLAVVYGIVKDLSGVITVSSNPGMGTTFQVFFPITEISETASVAVPGRLPTGKGRILVVDDERYIVEMLGEMLRELGYEVTARYSSSDALEAFQTQPDRFDLVITDQTMPHMTGTDLAKAMLKVRSDIPIVLCTGFSAVIDVARARKIGIKAFLMKPVALQQLAEEIHKLLSKE